MVVMSSDFLAIRAWFVFGDFTPSCAPRIGLQADAVQRARRMRLESPVSPPTLPLEGEGVGSLVF